MKRNKWNAGYTLIEVLVAISILGIIVVPVCQNLLMALRVNERTEDLIEAQLAVSSAVEILMAEGIGWEDTMGDNICYEPETCTTISGVDCYYDDNPIAFPDGDRFPEVTVNTKRVTGKPYYEVTVTHNEEENVSVKTYIHAVDVTYTGGAAE